MNNHYPYCLRVEKVFLPFGKWSDEQQRASVLVEEVLEEMY